MPERQREALYGRVRSGDYVAEGKGDLLSIPDFEARCCSEWESFREYAEGLTDGTGLVSAASDDVARYFDWSARTRDLALDYTVGGAEHCQLVLVMAGDMSARQVYCRPEHGPLLPAVVVNVRAI
ncbi:antirestriction protein ArdA [Micrococcus luteus]|nr:antirestriction protein ArdA [Micrococcus luteus]